MAHTVRRKNNLVSVNPRRPFIPIEFDVSASYDFEIDASRHLATLTVSSALGHNGIKALDSFYKSGAGKMTIPKLRAAGSSENGLGQIHFYHSPWGHSKNTLVDAVVNFDTKEDATVLAFTNDTLPDGELIYEAAEQKGITARQARVLFIAERIQYFLQENGAEEFTSRIVA